MDNTISEITQENKRKAIRLIFEIHNNLCGIVDYCNLSLPTTIDYKNKEHPIDVIEKWAKEARSQVSELEKLFEPKIES